MVASLVAQLVKHLPIMQETQVWSLGQEDPLEKEMATHSSTLAWKTHGHRGCKESAMTERLHFHFHYLYKSILTPCRKTMHVSLPHEVNELPEELFYLFS